MAEALAGAVHQVHVPFPRGLDIFITWIDGAALPKPSSITFTRCPGWGQAQRPTWV